jgi:hypothetical protein
MHTVYAQLFLSHVFTMNRVKILINTFHSP